ncbi:hypothetical protein [Amycolatopsis pittospori]|uniref:hypothetical protein n=1 Tax=Amycolatopsis pittospori TaxID=2749434 RepID=UPI0015F05BEC|nr:hypothetical protein [Amycolatopsis pittospori]
MEHTRPRLQAAKKMWEEAERWIDRTHLMLREASNEVASGWLDGPGREFVDRLRNNCTFSLGSWGGLEGFSGSGSSIPAFARIAFDQPLKGGITESGVIEQLANADAHLVLGAWVAAGEISNVERDAKNEPAARANLGNKLNEIAAQYQVTGRAMLAARGRAWDGPSGEIGSGLPSYGTGPSPTGTGGPNQNESPTLPDPNPGDPEQPATPQNPVSTPSALEQATDALSALSQAAESAQQLLGAGSNVNLPDPGSIDPGDWALPPYESSSYPGLDEPLGASSGSGMPSLAGGGLPDVGSGVGGPGGLPTGPTANGLPGSAMNGIGSSPGIAAAAGTSAGSSSGTSAAGAGGMPPPMMPPNGGGKNSAGGIKPGDADHAGSGRQRGPKSGATPGVALLGRSKGGGTRPATAQRRWDAENDTVHLLDEELWHVNEKPTDSQGKTANYRAGH